jgi:hypothetical protein
LTGPQVPAGPGRAAFVLANRTINRGLLVLLRTPGLHHTVSHGVAEITVTGRRSGRPVTLPVFYRQRDGVVRIHVALPGNKLWWRNLQGAGAPVRLRLRGRALSGHGEVDRRSDHPVVVVRLDPA